MARVSTVFGLSNSQAGLDFVDVDLSTDTPLYLDPYAIEIRHDTWSDACGDHIRSFFNRLLDALRAENHRRATHLLSNLHEPNETFLGVSKDEPRGRAIGEYKAGVLADALVNSRAFQTGLLTDISEAELFVRSIGPDTISDLTTNVVRGLLAEYTVEQCALHGIPTQRITTLGPVWNADRGDWQAREVQLPVQDQKPILLVPKFSVRRRLALNSQEFYNYHMVEFLQAEYLSAGSGLVQVLKDGTPYVTKKSVKEHHPFIKDDLADFVRRHPEVLEAYKNLRGAVGPLHPDELIEDFNEEAFAAALIENLGIIPPGGNDATRYHNFVMGVCTFLFYPSLITPIKEHEIHEGRKRIDIKFTNAADRGFFLRALQSPQMRALSVMIECKNYVKEMANPEFDQLSGRFGHQRGFFGMLMCRSMDNRARIIAACRDTVADGRGHIIVVEDADLIELLGFVASGQRGRIDTYLDRRLGEIIH